MSKKLLEEQAVRKFMKIAGLQPLTNSFLKESEDQKDSKEDKKEMEEGYGKKKMEESSDSEGEKLEEEVEDLEEGGGQMPFDAADRRADERAQEDRVNEAKSLVAKASKMKGDSHKMKPAKKAGGLVKEEEIPEEGAEDVETPEMDAAPEGDMGAGGLDVEGLVKELIRVITDRVPGASDVISVEDEGESTEVEMEPEMDSEMEPEMDSEDDESALDEASLETIVAETVKRVKRRLMESKKPALTKQDLVKKVAAKVAEKLKKA